MHLNNNSLFSLSFIFTLQKNLIKAAWDKRKLFYTYIACGFGEILTCLWGLHLCFEKNHYLQTINTKGSNNTLEHYSRNSRSKGNMFKILILIFSLTLIQVRDHSNTRNQDFGLLDPTYPPWNQILPTSQTNVIS